MLQVFNSTTAVANPPTVLVALERNTQVELYQ